MAVPQQDPHTAHLIDSTGPPADGQDPQVAPQVDPPTVSGLDPLVVDSTPGSLNPLIVIAVGHGLLDDARDPASSVPIVTSLDTPLTIASAIPIALPSALHTHTPDPAVTPVIVTTTLCK